MEIFLFNKKNLQRKPINVIVDHLVVFIPCFAIIVASFYFSPDDLENRRGPAKIIPPCLFKTITGMSCPTCGMTRAFSSISHGNIYSAFKYNPFSLVLYPTIATTCIVSFISLLNYFYLLKRKSNSSNKK